MRCAIRPSEKSLIEVRRALQQVQRELCRIGADVGDSGTALGGAGDARWTRFDHNDYDETPASISTVTLLRDLTELIQPGLPLKYRWLDVDHFGMVGAITPFLLTVVGAPFDTAFRLDDLWVGRPEMVKQFSFKIAGSYGGAVDDILDTIALTGFRWLGGPARIVAFQATNDTNDSTAQPFVNVKVLRT